MVDWHFKGLTGDSHLWHFFGVGKYLGGESNSPGVEWLNKGVMSVFSTGGGEDGEDLRRQLRGHRVRSSPTIKPPPQSDAPVALMWHLLYYRSTSPEYTDYAAQGSPATQHEVVLRKRHFCDGSWVRGGARAGGAREL
eukprot:272318-Pyramimonas_sp.AAC.1